MAYYESDVLYFKEAISYLIVVEEVWLVKIYCNQLLDNGMMSQSD